jgi:nucleotide-binding universal stress UspA family protein
MAKKSIKTEETQKKDFTILVAVDFSPYSALALRKARSMVREKSDRILALHVVDQDFAKSCVLNALGEEKNIKQKLFLSAKEKLKNFLNQEGMVGEGVDKLICEGIPYLEINRQAVLNDVEMIVMGSRGNSGDMNSIFFGSTTERVLRFIKRPVLCVPQEEINKST